jgi:hypothetical protein
MGTEELNNKFLGLGILDVLVSICLTRTLDPVLCLSDALLVLEGIVNDVERVTPFASGIVRI